MADPHYEDNLLKTVAHQVVTTVLGLAAAHLVAIWLGALAGAVLGRLLGDLREIDPFGALLVFYYLWSMIFSGIGVAWLVVQFGLVVGHMVYCDEPRTRWLIPLNLAMSLAGMIWLLRSARIGMF